VSFSDHQDYQLIADQLQRSLERGRLAHAYLFAGARGTGTADMARTLAKALNCLKKEHDACDRCDSCRRIDNGNHPDVYWVRPESKSRRITVDQIREFERSANLKAGSARVKIGIIVDADCMGEEASNAFLKTLEEPPAQTIIILLTAQPQRLLSTILSRCLRIAFGPAGKAESPYRARVVPLLANDATGIAGAYRRLAEMTTLLQAIRAEIRERVEAEDNLERYDELDPKVRERLENQSAARVEGEYRAAREQVLEEYYGWFGDVMLCVERADKSLLEHPDQLPALQRLADGTTYTRAAGNLEAIEQVRDALARNISEPLALEVGLLKLAGAA
jgi:DNA polymerase III subunit delta'